MKKLIFISALLLCSAFICNGQWTYTNLSEPKGYMGVTAHGTKAYFAGGWNGNNVSLVEIYDIATEEWDTSYDLSIARVVPGGVTCGNLVIFAGGGNLNNWVMNTEVDIFNTQTQQWTVDTLSVARAGVATVSNDTIVLFAGGLIASPWVTVDVVDIYNTQTEEWSTASLSEARDARAAAVVGNLALFAGGYNGQTLSKRVDIYNFTNDSWSIDSLPVARGWIQAVAIGDKVLFAGGMTSSNIASKRVDIYDVTNGTWSIDSLSFPRAFANNTAGAATCGKAFFAGGGLVNMVGLYWTEEYDVIDIYDEDSTTWSTDNLLNAITEHAVVAVEDKLIVAGGKDDGLVSTVSIYTCPSTSCLPEGIEFTTQAQIDSFQVNYPGCTEIEGYIGISGNDITNLNGLNVLNTVEEFLWIEDNNSLTSLTGLEGLTTIGDDIFISGNDFLTNLTGLNNLTIIEDSLSIWNNSSLINLTGLENLNTIGGDLSINSNDALINLSGLENLASIGGNLDITNNQVITSLSGLENIDNASITDLTIIDNYELYDCDVWSICQYLIAPGGTVVIENNKTECNSIEEVQEHCLTEIEEYVSNEELKIYPNPLGSGSIITYTLNECSHVTLRILDLSGREIITLVNKVQQQGGQRIEFKTTGLPAGVYFCVLKTNKEIKTKKVVKL